MNCASKSQAFKTWKKNNIAVFAGQFFFCLSVIFIVLGKKEVYMSGFIRKSAFNLKKIYKTTLGRSNPLEFYFIIFNFCGIHCFIVLSF